MNADRRDCIGDLCIDRSCRCVPNCQMMLLASLLLTAAGLLAIVIAIVRRDMYRGYRVLLAIYGTLITLICGFEALISLYVASCNPTASCL